jgi:hypothetical protein
VSQQSKHIWALACALQSAGVVAGGVPAGVAVVPAGGGALGGAVVPAPELLAEGFGAGLVALVDADGSVPSDEPSPPSSGMVGAAQATATRVKASAKAGSWRAVKRFMESSWRRHRVAWRGLVQLADHDDRSCRLTPRTETACEVGRGKRTVIWIVAGAAAPWNT